MDKGQDLPLRYLLQGKQEIGGWRAKLEVTARIETVDGRDWLVITSEDNGMGRGLEELPEKNWVKYQRIKKIAEDSGGRFEYKATEGKGAKSTAWFPVVKRLDESGKVSYVVSPNK